MARPALVDRLLRRQQPQGDGEGPAAAPPPQQRRPPTPGQLRRERRALVRAREERIRDLGGLILEMYKRDRFRQDLVLEQCAEVVSIEERIGELDAVLTAVTRRTLAEANRCACGAPLVWGAHFCANCGRAVGEQPVVVCAHCGSPLPAEASFCANCGREAEPAEAASYEEAAAQEATMAGQPPASASQGSWDG
jgi:Double zinc ribbon